MVGLPEKHQWVTTGGDMTDWVTFVDLMKRWGIQDFEVSGFFFQGLIPYIYGKPVPCPPYCHIYHQEYSRLAEANVEEKRKILELFDTITNDDPQAVSWKYFRLPDSENNIEKVMISLRKTSFKRSDVERIENELGLVLRAPQSNDNKHKKSATSKPEDFPKLSDKQKADYERLEYQCYDKISIPGTIPLYRSNQMVVNRNEIKMPDYLFYLFLRFVIELKKKKGGWVNISDFESEGIISDLGKYQIYSNLRTALQGSLLNKDGKYFIQNDGSKNYRISTHPDFITYDKKKLLNHQNPRISELAEKLP